MSVLHSGANVWGNAVRVLAGDAQAGDNFGRLGVALNGDRLVVGAPAEDELGAEAGALYVFARNAGVWTQVSKITAPDAAAETYFGYTVSLSDAGTLVVGALNYAATPYTSVMYVLQLGP